MTYQDRLIARKREFGRVFQTLSETGNGHDTTFPAPFGWNYIRNYWPAGGSSFVNEPMPHEVRNKNLGKFTRRFEY